MVAATILLQLGVTRAMAEDKGIIDWEALNPEISGATYVKASDKCLECHEEYIRTYAMSKMGRTLPDGGCESCHGPMSKHLDAPRKKPALVVSLSENSRLTAEQKGAICTQCHQTQGQGLPGAFPPLAKSDYLMADEKRAIDIVMNGLRGPIVVNGATYTSEMPKPGLTDVEVAAVLSYVRNSFGNESDLTTLAEVKAFRDSLVPPVPVRVAGAAQVKPARAPVTEPVTFRGVGSG